MIARTLYLALLAKTGIIILAFSDAGTAQNPGFNIVPELGLYQPSPGAGLSLDFDQDGTDELLVQTGNDRDLWSLSPDLRWSSRRLLTTAESRDVVIQATPDSFPDLVVVDRDLAGGLIRVFINQGGQGLVETAVLSFPLVGNDSGRVQAGDLTGDGLEDIVLTTVERRAVATVRVFPSLGNGQFAAPLSPGSLGIGSVINSWIGRFDADADLDMLVYRAMSLELFLNDGAGGLASVGDPTGGMTRLSASSAALDVDRDGILDFVAIQSGGVGSQSYSVLVNDGSGGLMPHVETQYRLPGSAIRVADVDGDGDSDLLALGDGSTFVFVENDGAGSLIVRDGKPSDVPLDLTSVGIGDLDGDGDDDIAAKRTLLSAEDGRYFAIDVPDPRRGRSVSVDLNDDGALEAVGGGGIWSQTPGGGLELLLRGDLNSLALAYDLNGDGMLDLISREQAYVVYTQVAPGSFVRSFLPIAQASGDRPLAVADFDGDGDGDVLVAAVFFAVELVLWRNPGVAGQPYTRELISHEVRTGNVEVADFDGDGDLDFVSAFANVEDQLFRNDGSGNFSAEPIGFSNANPDPLGITAGDLDADGDIDLVQRGPTSIRINLNRGNGTFFPGPVLTTSSDVVPSIGDLNGDGFPELVFQAYPGWDLEILENRAGSSFVSRTYPQVSDIHAHSFQSHLVDFDGDGDVDIPRLINTRHHLESGLPPAIGQTYRLTVSTQSAQPLLTAIILGVDPLGQPTRLGALQPVWLNPISVLGASPSYVLNAASNRRTWDVPIPNNPELIGVELIAQSVRLEGGALRIGARVSETIIR